MMYSSAMKAEKSRCGLNLGFSLNANVLKSWSEVNPNVWVRLEIGVLQYMFFLERTMLPYPLIISIDVHLWCVINISVTKIRTDSFLSGLMFFHRCQPGWLTPIKVNLDINYSNPIS